MLEQCTENEGWTMQTGGKTFIGDIKLTLNNILSRTKDRNCVSVRCHNFED